MKEFKPIIDPLPKEELLAELTEDKFLRDTNFGNNKIYCITANDSPKLMQEVGRQRELTFRAAGGGTGKDCDIDQFDTGENCYSQLIVWDDKAKEIQGGYRFIRCADVDHIDQLATTRLFDFSDEFVEQYLPRTIELGRSFVRTEYQSSSQNRKGMFILDNLWDGLGALIVDNPDVYYFLGKVTMYMSYDKLARDLIQFFMEKHFPDKDKLATPKEPRGLYHSESELAKYLTEPEYKNDHKLLSKAVREKGEIIPPLINTYMNISPSMRRFGTALNQSFGAVEETGIMVTINDIYPSKKNRHILSYNKRPQA